MTSPICKGTLVRWKDDKGYGFIAVEGGDTTSSQELFIHAQTLRHMSRRPQVGDRLFFQIETQANGKRAAVNARIDGVTVKQVAHHNVPPKRPIKRKRKADSPLMGIMLRIVIMMLLLALGSQLYQGFWLGAGEPSQTTSSALPDTRQVDVETNADRVIARAFELQQSGVMVQSQGRVSKLLADDNDGSRHQKFILRLSSGQTLLVAHNIDLAPRIDSLNVGDQVSFAGQYEWNNRGGVLHWTHLDPNGRHQGGWLKHNGRIYQ
ncbi:DUF3465 domain-containing protein [Shewanella colwelliana]